MKIYYTTERLRKKSKSAFDLTKAAIQMARNRIVRHQDHSLNDMIHLLDEEEVIDFSKVERVEKPIYENEE
jgi:hypothetical protein